MKNYITFTRKNLLVLLLFTVCTVCILNQLYFAANQEQNALTNAERLNYLKIAGHTVLSDTPTTQSVTLPENFSNVYKQYNQLQLSAGYDLTLYKGCEVTIYSYKIDAPVGYTEAGYANMIVYNNRIIGGDVSSMVLGEYMLPLRACK